MRLRILAVIGLLLAGCASLPAATEDPTSPAPVSSTLSGDTQAPPPLSNPRDAAYWTESSPRYACLNAPVVLHGYHWGKQTSRVSIWLQGASPSWIPGMPRPNPANIPYAVKLGEAVPDANGNFEFTFIPRPRMRPLSTGGELTVDPRRPYNLLILDDTGEVHYGMFSLAMPGVTPSGAAEPCPAASLPDTPQLIVNPDPVCPGDTATLRGINFAPGPVHIVVHLWGTRFGDGPSLDFNATADAQGKFSLPLSLVDDGRHFYQRGQVYDLIAYDQNNSRETRRRFPLCSVVSDTLALPGISFRTLAFLHFTNYGPPPSGEPPENAVLSSQAELDAFLSRHHAANLAIAGADFTQEQVVAVFNGGSEASSQFVEILRIEEQADAFVVHTIAWWSSPSMPEQTLHLVAMPRSSKPVRFAETQRASGMLHPSPYPSFIDVMPSPSVAPSAQ